MLTNEDYAARLHAMSETAEERSLENPNVPITAAQLSTMIGGPPTRSGVQVDELSAMTFVPVYAAVAVIARAVAMLPIVTFAGDPNDPRRQRAINHPVYRMLALSPNPEMTATVFKETLQGHLGLWGNAYARIVRDRADRIVSLYPLLPDRTRAERKGGELQYLSSGETFAPEEILHIPGLGFDGLRGYSPIGLAREAIGLGKAAEMFGAGFFGNGANVGGIITVPGKMTPDQRAANASAWSQAHQGVGNVAKTAMMDGGATYTRIGIPPEDAQFLDTRKFQRSEIASLYHVPPHMIGDLERATFSNIEQQSLDFLIHTLTPWLEKWEQEINRKLFDPTEQMFVNFDERRLLRADNAARQAYYASARQWGYLSVNEIRGEEGMNPIGSEGDVYLQPGNMMPAGEPEPSEPPAKSETPPPAKRAADVMLGVIADAVTRMARKESNAISRAGDNAEKVERFYAEHERHVIEALTPIASAMARVCDANETAEARAISAIQQYAKRRNGVIESRDLSTESAALAEQIQQSLEGSL